MAVIYLPPDPRVTGLEAGLQQFGGNVADYVEGQRLADVLQQGGDPSQMLPRVLARGGLRAAPLAMLFANLREQQARTGREEAETKLTGAQTGLVEKQTSTFDRQEALKLLDLQTKILEGNARLGEISAQTSLAKAKAAMTPAEQRKLEAEAAKANMEVEQAKQNREILNQVMELLKSGGELPNQDMPTAPAEGGSTVRPTKTTTGPLGSLDTADKAQLALAAGSGKPDRVAAAIGQITNRKLLKNPPADTNKLITSTAGFNSDLNIQLKNMADVPTGDVRGKLTELAQRWGLNPSFFNASDPVKTRMLLESLSNADISAATSQGGFFSRARYDIVKYALPSAVRDQLTNLSAVSVFARNRLEELRAARDSLADRTQTKGIDRIIDETKDIVNRVDRFQYSIVKDGPTMKLNLIDVPRIEELVPKEGIVSAGGKVIDRNDIIAIRLRNPNKSIDQIVQDALAFRGTAPAPPIGQ